VTVKTGAENLVVYISFDTDNLIETGEGITFKENKGDASIATGFIGKGWTNKSGKNNVEAYSKFDVASGSAFSKISNISFSAWVKVKKDAPKGGMVSLNGARNSAGNPHDFPAFNVYYDNFGTATNEETGEEEPWQQVNGRFIFHDANGNEQNLWLDTGAAAFAKYDDWAQFAFTYDATSGQVLLYLNGEHVAERTFEPKIAFNNLVTEYSNAFYVGGWSSFIEGDANADWQSFWSGSLDEIRFFDRVLTPDEILALYGEELAINLDQE